MALIDSIAGIASNLGLSKLAPSNGDAIRESIHSLSKHTKSANVYRSANREAKFLSDNDFLEKAQTAADKAMEYEADGKVKKAMRKNDEAAARLNITTAHQTALGREGSVERNGAKLEGDSLKKFRDINNTEIKTHTKSAQKARKELMGHAKDYYFSDEGLGTNAMRWGATGAAYGALAVGTRTLTGGSATTNNQGQRDIAGIPFI